MPKWWNWQTRGSQKVK